ncbi:MAG: hypothetical protein KDB35_05575 [Acidimicrobiales bacterium]|nr:hypothetical protein [Acidimicrobiales bacterium]MCB9372529.1 hypothetical protein [Microthrixaceae bacterium]
MVAFVVSVLVLLVMVAPIPWYAKRRPVGTFLSWGEAMLAAVFVFFVMFWAYGVVPHQWLTWADNELNWRPDSIVSGPGNVFTDYLPFTITYQTLRDLIAVGIYGIFLGGQIALWALWQGRGDKKPGDEVETSRYGRPLVREGV